MSHYEESQASTPNPFDNSSPSIKKDHNQAPKKRDQFKKERNWQTQQICFMIGLFNIIPYFGAIVAVIVAGIITIFTDGLSTALWMTLIIIIVQQLDANVLNPRILGNSLHVSPILVIFATTVGGAYFGVLGMFLGVPVIALIKIFLIDYVKERNELKHSDVVEIDKE